MKTFKQYLEEAEAYGWLNRKGSFIRNRDLKSKGSKNHGDTYTKFTGNKTVDYFEKIGHALKNDKWTRIDINADPRTKELTGYKQHMPDAWTPRHDKAMKRIIKALRAKKYRKNIETIHDAS